MKPRIVGLICARGGSKGLPHKNILPLAGRPLFAWAVEVARQSRLISEIVVSTDDDEVVALARKYGAEVPFLRPAELAKDDTPEWLVWRHALDFLDKREPDRPVDVLVSIPPTSPLRTNREIDACAKVLMEGDADIVITVTEAARNPYFNMVVLDNKNVARLVVEPKQNCYRRQDAPPVFEITTVAYAVRPEYVRNMERLFSGRVEALVVDGEVGLDIDRALDFKIAELLMAEREQSIR